LHQILNSVVIFLSIALCVIFIAANFHSYAAVLRNRYWMSGVLVISILIFFRVIFFYPETNEIHKNKVSEVVDQIVQLVYFEYPKGHVDRSLKDFDVAEQPRINRSTLNNNCVNKNRKIVNNRQILYSNGDIFWGDIDDQVSSGFGVTFFCNDQIIILGESVNDKPYGKVVLIDLANRGKMFCATLDSTLIKSPHSIDEDDGSCSIILSKSVDILKNARDYLSTNNSH